MREKLLSFSFRSTCRHLQGKGRSAIYFLLLPCTTSSFLLFFFFIYPIPSASPFCGQRFSGPFGQPSTNKRMYCEHIEHSSIQVCLVKWVFWNCNRNADLLLCHHLLCFRFLHSFCELNVFDNLTKKKHLYHYTRYSIYNSPLKEMWE